MGRLYAIICTDKPNSVAIRKAKRPEHVEYLQSLGDTLILAGPFTEADGDTMNGSLIVIEAASLDAARKIAAPLRQSGLVRFSRDPPVVLGVQQAERRRRVSFA